jgi:hypothetical protein
MNALLRLVPPAERATVRAKAQRLADEARAWANPVHDRLGSRLYESLAMTVAAIAPWLAHAELSMLVRFSLWAYLLDDRLDAPAADRADARAVGRVVAKVLRTGRASSPDFLETGLAEVYRDLRRYDPRGHVTVRFAVALCDGVRAAVTHVEQSRRLAQGKCGQPAAEEYLDIAARHVHYRSFALALLAMVGDDPSHDELDFLDATLVPAAIAVRLSNDLCTFGKDQREGNLNVLGLRSWDGATMTPDHVDGEIERQVNAHLALLERASIMDLGDSRAALANSLRISVGLYRIGDLKEAS